MQPRANEPPEPTPEQRRYAQVLEKGMYAGLVCLFVSFTLYVSGIMQPLIPLEELSGYWSHSVHEYLEETGIEAGWGWVKMLGYGDFINFVGVAFLAGVTVPCYLAIIPLLLRGKDTVYVVLALLEVAVLVVAASGIVGAGH
jgi:hypothetical protein